MNPSEILKGIIRDIEKAQTTASEEEKAELLYRAKAKALYLQALLSGVVG